MKKREISGIQVTGCPNRDTNNCLECPYYAGLHKNPSNKYDIKVLCGKDNEAFS